MADHSLPPGGVCQHDIPAQGYSLSIREWKDEFWPYYQRERQLLFDAAAKTLDELFDDPADRADSLRTVEEELGHFGSSWLGPLGEAHVSYLVEERWKQEDRLLLVKAAWKANPFDVVQGVDLIGVRLHDGYIHHLEVKARRESADYLVKRTMEELKKDLALVRIQNRAGLSIGTAAYEYIQTALLRLLRQNPTRYNANIRVKNPRSDGFSRLGAIVAGPGDWQGNLRHACPCDASALHPCALLFLFVEEFEKQVVLLVTADRAANRKLLRSLIKS